MAGGGTLSETHTAWFTAWSSWCTPTVPSLKPSRHTWGRSLPTDPLALGSFQLINFQHLTCFLPFHLIAFSVRMLCSMSIWDSLQQATPHNEILQEPNLLLKSKWSYKFLLLCLKISYYQEALSFLIPRSAKLSTPLYLWIQPQSWAARQTFMLGSVLVFGCK